MLERERTDVAEACRRLAQEGLVIGTAGNVSAKAGEDGIAVSPTGAVLAELAPEQVSVVDLEGNLIAGELEPTSELGLHLGIYERYDAGAVVHTHAPDVVAALDRALLLEWACTVYWRATAIGEPKTLDEAQRQAVVSAALERGYGTTRPAPSDDEAGE
jgi:L-fuculose-phosphate aldolase